MDFVSLPLRTQLRDAQVAAQANALPRAVVTLDRRLFCRAQGGENRRPAEAAGVVQESLRSYSGERAHLSTSLSKSGANGKQQTWQKTKSLPSNEMALDAIRMYMEQLASILNEESRSPAPHLALSFSASSQIYVTVSRIACTAYNETIIKRAVSILSALVESEEEEFVWHQRFAESVTHLVDRVLSSGSIAVGEDTLSEIVELLFGIVAKIRLQPTLLPVWFIPKSLEKGSSNLDGAVSGPFTPTKVGFAGETQKEDFPLCYYLIDHVHHEGRIGDFARTGLLYIFETASKYESLEEWLVGSDIPTLMATGLGALYSQLSR